MELFEQAHRRIGRRNGFRVEPGVQHDAAHEQGHQHQAGKDAGDEQPGDRHVGGHAVNDHDDRRRDHDAQGAGAGERAQNHLFVVAAFEQLGHGHAADGDRRGGR